MIMFPSNWGSRVSSACKKRTRTAETPPTEMHVEVVAEDPPSSHGVAVHGCFEKPDPVADDFDVCQRILKSVNCSSNDMPEQEISLDTLLSNMPYRAMLCSAVGRDQQSKVDVPVIARAYEETFMRETYGAERACASGALCECMFIDKTAPFVGTELLLPGETTGSTPQLCVLCTRKVTQKLFYDVLLADPLGVPNGVIQRYGNICGVPGEYAQECMLICPAERALECMPHPSMSHQRNRYVVYISNNMKFLRQANVTFEDFRNPSTNAQT